MIKTKEIKRDVVFDVVRALCILEIVCFWHLKEYLDISIVPQKLIWYCGNITGTILGTFSFMSAFFLKRKKIESMRDVKIFYLTRLKRFWLLYFIASLSLYVASSFAGQPWYSSFSNFILSLFGLTIFFSPLPATLWYMVMLMFFYIITPLILYMRTLLKRLILIVFILLVFILLNHWGGLDERVLYYFPMYALGLVIPDRFINNTIKSNYKIAILSCIIYIICIYIVNNNVLRTLLLCFVGVPIIIYISALLAKNDMIKVFSKYISYSSLNMYLFHRHIYLSFLILWNIGKLSNIREATFPLWIVIVVWPFIIVGSYYIQYIYDSIIDKLFRK